jgi:hypothetical protein
MRQIRVTFLTDISDDQGHFVAEICSLIVALADDQDFSARCLELGRGGLMLDSDATHPITIPGCADAVMVWIAPHCIRRIELLTDK